MISVSPLACDDVQFAEPAPEVPCDDVDSARCQEGDCGVLCRTANLLTIHVCTRLAAAHEPSVASSHRLTILSVSVTLPLRGLLPRRSVDVP